MKKTIVILLIILCSVASVCSKELEIFVIDRDLDLPLEGVKIIEADSGTVATTDQNGICVLEIPEDTVRAVIITQLVGYEPRKQLVTNFSKTLEIGLLMEGILEGQELVVEAEAIGETDEEVGVSTVVEKEVIEAASKMGLIEDVMNVVKILPGVTYAGGFGSELSVRGGDPSGLTAVMDGFTTKYPYHWGGAFSIFNPNLVESIKFSPGVFSAKYGQATSALMEVKTVDPTDGLKLKTVLSTSTIEGFAQVPLGKNRDIGILGGFRLTNYDLALATVNFIADETNDQNLKDTTEGIYRAPYIYDFYFKTLYSPSETFKWHLNGFWGNDGIGVNSPDEDNSTDVNTYYEFDYLNSDFFVSTGVKLLPTDNLLLNLTVGYERWEMDIDAKLFEEGTRKYSQEFIDNNSAALAALGNPDSFSIFTTSDYNQSTDKHGFQGRLDVDWSVSENLIFQTGVGSTFDINDESRSGALWTIVDGDPYPEYKLMDYGEIDDTTKNLLSFGYINFNTNLIPDFLKLDLGVRVDHSYFMGKNNYTLNTYPEVAPRLNVTMTPNIDNRVFRDNSFSFGSGLFNKTPFSNGGISEELGVKDYELKAEKTLINIIGWETHLPNDFRFKIEGYYKYIFDRFYYNEVETANDVDFKLHFDGYGHAYGADFLLERKKSRFYDGMLTYTFVNARYMDPKSDGVENDSENVRGEYYYPSYHRFHSLNFLMNIKPTNGFTFTSKLSFATGAPKGEKGNTIMFPATVTDVNGNTQLAEMYTSTSIYSETLRTNFALPLDVKFAWHNYKPDSKYQWEFYFAIQNLLAPLITSIQSDDNTETGKWSGSDEASPDSGFSFPIPSVGFSLSF